MDQQYCQFVAWLLQVKVYIGKVASFMDQCSTSKITHFTVHANCSSTVLYSIHTHVYIVSAMFVFCRFNSDSR